MEGRRAREEARREVGGAWEEEEEEEEGSVSGWSKESEARS